MGKQAIKNFRTIQTSIIKKKMVKSKLKILPNMDLSPYDIHENRLINQSLVPSKRGV